MRLFKKDHGITVDGFPFDTLHDFFEYHTDVGMLGFFLRFIQKYNFIIISNNKKIIVVYKNKQIYNKEVDHDPYDLVGRFWFGVLICLSVIEKQMK